MTLKTMETHLIAIFVWYLFLNGAKTYAPAWESLDTRPVLPVWSRPLVLGIFIHWGLYSVLMWSPGGTYSEWYNTPGWTVKTLLGNGDFTGIEVYDYHKKNVRVRISFMLILLLCLKP